MKLFLEVAKEAALKAGEYIVNEKNNSLRLEQKTDKSFVTHADQESERIIRELIFSSFPEHEICGEEQGHDKKGSSHIWYVDPIDGTHNYMKGFPYYAVSIGLAIKNELTVGVIYIPEFDELYYASKGKGAFLNGKKLDLSSVEDSKLMVSFELAGSDELKKETMDQFLETLMYNFSHRKLGSSACDMALVSKGVLSAHIGPRLTPYDVAAGIVIVKEAGGFVTDFKGNEVITPFEPNIVCVNNKRTQKILFEGLKQ